jgi:phosphatidylserine/phosphatidylglycerophosphate/cardiolipin synthase-like enzyme
VDAWFSPNTEKTGSSKTRTVPLDLKEVYELMKRANDAILFLVFNPGRTAADGEDVNTVVSAAINFGRHNPDLLVMGAISDPTAVPGYEPPPQPPAGQKKPKAKSKEPSIPLPAIFTPAGLPKVLMIRAAALKDVIGDFQKELLKVGTAIIHDKVVVIDPLSPNCAVITGSHNLGFKASYANDENMLLIQGNQALAQAYAVHVMDVYEHYRFRAVQEQRLREAMLKNGGKPPKEKVPTGGFLDTDPAWQTPYFDGTKGQDTAYFVK